MNMAIQARVATRSLLLQSCWNYEGMQNVGFAFALQPWLRSIEKGGGPPVQDGLRRHLEYFNTQPYMAAFVLGVTGRLEEERAAAPEGARIQIDQRITRLKAAFGSALAGVGDALFWGTMRPACAALAMCVWLLAWTVGAAHPVGWALTVYLAAYNGPALWVRWKGISLGYSLGEGLAGELKRFKWQDRMKVLRWAGLGLAVLATGAALLVPPWDFAASWKNVWVLAAALAARRLGYPTPRVYAASVGLFIVAAWARLA